jgi:hypothetical protein
VEVPTVVGHNHNSPDDRDHTPQDAGQHNHARPLTDTKPDPWATTTPSGRAMIARAV